MPRAGVLFELAAFVAASTNCTNAHQISIGLFLRRRVAVAEGKVLNCDL